MRGLRDEVLVTPEEVESWERESSSCAEVKLENQVFQSLACYLERVCWPHSQMPSLLCKRVQPGCLGFGGTNERLVR